MAGLPKTVFLQRDTYRRRRIGDAIKLLPIAGVVLFFMPLLLGTPEQPAQTSSLGLFIFFSWFALIGMSVLLVALFNRTPHTTREAEKPIAEDPLG
ncbi:hypothetical protein [Nereida sp.]|uniref:hypothetical protein n=1 Tax=Nereida sp. TaxID=2736090 RepID=UPI003F69A8B7